MTNSSNISKELWTVNDIYRATLTFLEGKEIDDAKVCTELFLMDALRVEKKHELYMMFDSIVEEEEKIVIRDYMKRRVLGEPVQYIIGKAYFYGYEFSVDKRVLIPRGDTEHIIDGYASYCKKVGVDVLDLCTGSGAIGLSLKKMYPKINMTLSDISKDAIDVATQNSINLNVDVNTVCGNGLSCFDDESFDIIVSNPPYILSDIMTTLDVEVKNWEPHLALDGGGDGLDFYRETLSDLFRVLKSGGYVLFEYGGFGQTDEIIRIYEVYFVVVDVIKDYNDIDRIIVLKKRS